MTFRSRKLLDLARDQACVMCGRNDGSTVAAHRNHGKGMAMKAPDYAVAWLCHGCHAELDQGKDMTRDERRAFWLEAHARTVAQWFEQGKVAIR